MYCIKPVQHNAFAMQSCINVYSHSCLLRAETMPQQAFPSDVPAQAPTSQLQTDLAGTYSEQSFPPFQPFPARSAPPENDNSVPSSRPRDAQSELSSSITHCGSPSMEPVKGVSIQASHQGTGGPEPMQRQHTPTLPAFTPFPAAAPSSRYAPPRGSRVQHTRPFLPPISSLDIEPSSNGFQYPVRSLDVVGSTSIAGYPR
jgi:hypothetical protein